MARTRTKSIDDISKQQADILDRALKTGDVGFVQGVGFMGVNRRGERIIKALNKGNEYKDNIRKTKAWQRADRSDDSEGPGNRLQVSQRLYMGNSNG